MALPAAWLTKKRVLILRDLLFWANIGRTYDVITFHFHVIDILVKSKNLSYNTLYVEMACTPNTGYSDDTSGTEMPEVKSFLQILEV